MKHLLVLALFIFSSSLLAQSREQHILSILPNGVYNGENCQVIVGKGFSEFGVGISINHLNNFGTLVSTGFVLFDESPWTKVIKDLSTEETVDVKVKRNNGVIQRLVMAQSTVTIEDYKRSRVIQRVSCLLR